MTEKPSIAIFIGAGAECIYGMPQGEAFKKETILCEKAITFMKSFNKERDSKDNYLNNVTSGKFIRHNSTNILYQSYKEISVNQRERFLNYFDDDEKEIIKKYDHYRCAEIKDKEEKKKIIDDFGNLYRTKIYDPITKVQSENDENSKTPEIINYLSFYSSIDSDFNYLRLPNTYKKECCNVMKLYYSAYLSILGKIIDDKYYTKIISKNAAIDKDVFLQEYEKGVEEVINKTTERTYYDVIKENISAIKTIITTNYTHIIDKVVGKNKCTHIHGTMTEFESLNSKEINELPTIPKKEIVFPYILIQSGIKPIINHKEIETFNCAFRNLKESKIIIVLGYSFSSDDEHIITAFREMLKGNKHTIYYFNFAKNLKDKEAEHLNAINKLDDVFKEDAKKIIIKEFFGTDDFEKELTNIINASR